MTRERHDRECTSVQRCKPSDRKRITGHVYRAFLQVWRIGAEDYARDLFVFRRMQLNAKNVVNVPMREEEQEAQEEKRGEGTQPDFPSPSSSNLGTCCMMTDVKCMVCMIFKHLIKVVVSITCW